MGLEAHFTGAGLQSPEEDAFAYKPRPAVMCGVAVYRPGWACLTHEGGSKFPRP